MNLNDLLELTVRSRPQQPALDFYDSGDVLHTISFEEVALRSRRMASVLHNRGLRMGDRLCVYLANSVEMIDVYLACLALGVIFVPINILYKEREITHILQDAEPKAIVVDGTLPAAAPHLWQLKDLAGEADTASPETPRAILDGDDAAAVIYTSGTTGTSKGAVLTHNNLASNAINLHTCWRIDSEDRLLLALPLFHVHGLGNGLHCWLISGCRMRLLERFDHRRAEEMFLSFRPTVFFGVPTVYVRLLEMPEPSAREIGSFMRLFVSGSAPLPVHVLEDFRSRYGHTILERYGMSETLMNISNPYAGERRPGTVGLPLPGVSVQVRDADGKIVPAGVSGELYVRGPNVFAGYWRNEPATRAAFDGEYFRTGDIGTRAEDGYYTLQGRRSDLIISGGFNVYPREIEDFLTDQEGVREAAVAGTPDRVRGEVPVAYVVCDPELDLDSLKACCQSALASFKFSRLCPGGIVAAHSTRQDSEASAATCGDGDWMRIDELPTPALLLDAELFEGNILRMAEYAAHAGKKLRPHAKAHKCVPIARRQMQAGAVGVCVATVSEAELMARSGIGSLLLTSPLADSTKCARMAAIAEHAADVAVVVDHVDQVRLYGAAARRAGTTLKVLVDLDVGDHRTGIGWGQPALELARTIVTEPNLQFEGLQAYSVRASHMSSAEGVATFSSDALSLAAATKELLEKDGIATPTITGGSTGTYAADSQLSYMTELQAGSYALMDVAYARIGITEFSHAATVMATVVSANHEDRVTVDAGFKAFATDRAFGPDVQGIAGARYQWAGDEFGFVFVDDAQSRPRLGDRLRFLPPHCDPTVNLYDRIYVCSGDIVLETWPVMDRTHAN